MADRCTLHLACNDLETGTHLESFVGAEFHVGDEMLVSIDQFYGERVGLLIGDGFVEIAQQRFEHRGHAIHVGNQAWDSVDVSLDDARAVLKLLQARRWVLYEWVCNGPFADIVNEIASEVADD